MKFSIRISSYCCSMAGGSERSYLSKKSGYPWSIYRGVTIVERPIKKLLFQNRLVLKTLFGKTMRELKWITVFTPYSVRISLKIANILIFKYNLSNIFDNIIPLFNEIHVNAHVRTYELYSYLPSFGHNDFFFSIQSKRNRYS